MSSDVTFDETIKLQGNVTLDLDGRFMTYTGSGSFIYLNSKTATLKDSQTGNEELTHYYYINETTHLAVIAATEADAQSGNPSKNGFFIGGCITGGNSSNGYLSGVFYSGILTMESGTIIGSGVTGVMTDRFTMTGGNIIGCADGAYHIESYGRFDLSGGRICHNYATNTNYHYGGITHQNGGTFNLSGNPEIYGNYDNEGERNIHVGYEKKINIVGPLTNTIKIGISAMGTFTNGLSGNGDDKKFTSNNSYNKYVGINGGEAVLYTNPILGVKSDGTFSGNYPQLSNALSGVGAGGTVKLLGDIVENSDISFSSGINNPVTLDLNGHSISYNGSSKLFTLNSGYEYAGSLIIKDNDPTAEHKYKINTESATSYGEIDEVNGTLSFTGGYIAGNGKAICVDMANNTFLKVDGGTLLGFTTTAINNASGGKLEITGGNFLGNQKAVTYNKNNVEASYFKLKGAPVIREDEGGPSNHIDLRNATSIISVNGELSNEASIKVITAGAGVFTTGYTTDDAEDPTYTNTAPPSAYFRSPGFLVLLQDGEATLVPPVLLSDTTEPKLNITRGGDDVTTTAEALEIGDILTVSTLAIPVTYQWYLVDSSTLTETAIEGATGTTYTIIGSEKGKQIRVKVTQAEDACGEDSPASDVTYSATTTLPISVVASVTEGESTTYYKVFADAVTAINAATNASTLMLMDDVTGDVSLTTGTAGAKAVTIDLNGYGITGTGTASVIIVNRDDGENAPYVALTLTDSNSTGTGGFITGGHADNGGGIFVKGSLTMNGGTISGNTGGGVKVDGGTLRLSGNPKITGNTAGEEACNVYTASAIVLAGALTAGAQIGVTWDDDDGIGVFTDGYTNEEVPSTYFASDEGYNVRLENGEAAFFIYKELDDTTAPVVKLDGAAIGTTVPQIGQELSIQSAAEPVEYGWYYADSEGNPTGDALSTTANYTIQTADFDKQIVGVAIQRIDGDGLNLATPVTRAATPTKTVEKKTNMTEATVPTSVTKTWGTITVSPTVAGQEYLVVLSSTATDALDWTKAKKAADTEGLTFDGLKHNTEYAVYTRIAETDDTKAGPVSSALNVTTVAFDGKVTSEGVTYLIKQDTDKSYYAEVAGVSGTSVTIPESLASENADLTALTEAFKAYFETSDYPFTAPIPVTSIGVNALAGFGGADNPAALIVTNTTIYTTINVTENISGKTTENDLIYHYQAGYFTLSNGETTEKYQEPEDPEDPEDPESPVIDEDKSIEIDGETYYGLSEDLNESFNGPSDETIAFSANAINQVSVNSDGELVVAKGADVDMVLMHLKAGSTIKFTHSGTIVCDQQDALLKMGSKTRGLTRGTTMEVEAGATYLVLKDCDLLLTLKTSVDAVIISDITITLGGGTAIDGVVLEDANDLLDAIYNIQGQRVVHPKKGLYIKNGKLTIIK